MGGAGRGAAGRGWVSPGWVRPGWGSPAAGGAARGLLLGRRAPAGGGGVGRRQPRSRQRRGRWERCHHRVTWSQATASQSAVQTHGRRTCVTPPSALCAPTRRAAPPSVCPPSRVPSPGCGPVLRVLSRDPLACGTSRASAPRARRPPPGSRGASRRRPSPASEHPRAPLPPSLPRGGLLHAGRAPRPRQPS